MAKQDQLEFDRVRLPRKHLFTDEINCRWWCLHRKPYMPGKDSARWYLYHIQASKKKDAITSIQSHKKQYGWTDCRLVDMQDVLVRFIDQRSEEVT